MAKPAAGAQPDPTARVVDRLLAQLARTAPRRAPAPAPAPESPPPGRPVDSPVFLVPPMLRPRRSARVLEIRPSRGGGATGPAEPLVSPVVGLWSRVVLAAGFAVALTQWPYSHDCGWGLAAYLFAVATALVSGAWVGLASWRLRLGAAHLVAFMLIYWGLVLAAEQVLPRIGYAAEAATWSCPLRR